MSRIVFCAIFFTLFACSWAQEQKRRIAVDKFNITPSLGKMKVSGWWIAEKMENELAQTGVFQVMTRARIASILKEKRIGSSSALNPKALGKIVGAHYIVSGQAEYSDGMLTICANLLDVKEEAGAYQESYDDSISANESNIHARITELVEALAKKFSMTTGELLDYGLRQMKSGDFQEAAQTFKDLTNRQRIKELHQLMTSASQKKVKSIASTLNTAGKSPGELIDYAIDLMHKKDSEKAAAIFYFLNKSQTGHYVRNLMKLAQQRGIQAKEKLEKIIASARRKYQNAIANKAKQDMSKDPSTLCDEAAAELRSFMSDPKIHLSKREKENIRGLIKEIESFRKGIFSGPAQNSVWTAPDLQMTLIPIKSGTFKRVIDEANEEYVRAVTITRPFWIGKCEVSVKQFGEFLETFRKLPRKQRYDQIDRYIKFESEYCPYKLNYNSKRGINKNQPVTCVSWQAAKKFCHWLTEKEDKAGRLPKGYEYRLPTEAEWEYACRAGTKTAFSFGDNTVKAGEYAWFKSNASGGPESCGKKKPNPWGLYDMHGNVWEWCEDWYAEKLPDVDVENPIGPEDSGENCKVLRGGSYVSSPMDLRCIARYSGNYKKGKKNVGFRIVCAPEL